MAEVRGWLGIDVGWVFPAADSDGNVYRWTRRPRPDERIAIAGPVTVRRANGSTSTYPAYSLAEAAQVFARAERFDGPIRILTTTIVRHAQRTDRGIALEDWLHFHRRKAAWVDVWSALSYRAAAQGVPVTQVNRAYTSITCPKCHRKDRANRETRSRFRCVECGFSGQADVVAAMNISAKAAGRFEVDAGDCSNPACEGRVAWAAGLCVFCYRFRRREGRLPGDRELAERAAANDQTHYRNLRRGRIQRATAERREAETRRRLAESYATHDAWGNPLASGA